MSRLMMRLVCGFVVTLLVGLVSVKVSNADPKSDDSADGKARVVIKPGRADGSFSAFSRQSRNDWKRHADWKGMNRSEKKISVEDQEIIASGCWGQVQDTSCLDVAGPSGVAVLLTGPLARAMAVNLVARLRFPAPKPIFGPNPNRNEWKMLAVGFPVWMWTEGPTTVSTSTSSNGFTFQMTARWRSTTFDMGDGNSVTCTSMTRYSASVKPGTASPNCGHVYASGVSMK